METVFVISVVITFIFFIMKVLEMKYIQKEIRPLKDTIRDSVIVLGSSMVSLSLFYYAGGSLNDFFNILTDKKTLNPSATEIFTGEPGF